MKGFKLNLFLFIAWWIFGVVSSVDNNAIYSALKPQTTHQGFIMKENDLNADEHMINLTSDTVNYSQDFFYTEDLKKICHAQVNEFIWKCPTISDSEEKILKFRTINDTIDDSLSMVWYLKSINEIDVVKMEPKTYKHQIEFKVEFDEQIISLNRLYPTYPEISGFEILQFITNLAYQCEFLIHVHDASDVTTIYSTLYGITYYEYHFKGIDLNQNFSFKKIIVKKETFLYCLEKRIEFLIETLSELFYQNIQICENAFVSVEFCPITFETQRIFYTQSFKFCIDWSPIGGFQDINLPFSNLFEIDSKDIVRIIKRKQQSNYFNFVKITRALDKKINKTYDEIKAQIFDESFLMKIFFNIFELCFFELEKRKSNPNPEDIFKIYLRPCVIPNINLFLKYYTNV